MEGYRKPRCEDCRFFAPDGDDVGECRKDAPAITEPRWPRVHVDHWCGEWRSLIGEEFYLWDNPVYNPVSDP